MMSGWMLQNVAGSLKCSSPLSPNVHKLVNDAKRWHEQCVRNALFSIPVARLHERIMSMVFGVESLRKNGMLPVIDSLHQLAFAPFLSANPLTQKRVGTGLL